MTENRDKETPKLNDDSELSTTSSEPLENIENEIIDAYYKAVKEYYSKKKKIILWKKK